MASAADMKNMIEEDDDNIVNMSDEEEEDGFPSLEDFLVTDDGDNIANGIVKALDRVTRQIDTQNKIFIKMYTALMKIAENSSHCSGSKA